MVKTSNKDIWFAVVNVFAASKKAASRWSKAESVLKSKGVVYHGVRTGKGGNASELTFDACMAGYRRFIAVGGDGTVHDVLNGIAAFIDGSVASGKSLSFSEFTLGVIPLGSGNDWIKSLSIKSNVEDAVNVLAHGRISSQDVVKVSILDRSSQQQEVFVSYMANVGGVGIDARVCEKVNAEKKEGKRGKILYVKSLLYALSQRKPAGVKVICDGKEIFEGSFLSIAFGVGKYSGGGMRQTPAAVLDDGLLDMTLIPEVALGRIAREVFRLFTGTFLQVPEVVSAKGKMITVLPYEGSSAEPVEVDGEVVGRSPVRFEVMPDQIGIMVP